MSESIFYFQQVIEEFGISEELMYLAIKSRWISPFKLEEKKLDHEDLARLQLIAELRDDFGVNNDSIPIILHLIDQLHALRNRDR